MITIQSTVNSDYSATIYPLNQYGGGNGYFFHKTGSDSGIAPMNLPADVVEELRPKAKQVWGTGKMIDIQSITIVGRRWFQKSAGNTYFSADILVNGEQVGQIPYEYGYGSQYLDSSTDWLESHGYIEREHHSNGSAEQLYQVAEKQGFKLNYQAVDVPRKKDL